MIDGQKGFDQPVKNDLKADNNTVSIATDQEDDYTTDCLLDHPYF